MKKGSSFKRLPDRTTPGLKPTSLKPRKRSDPKLSSPCYVESRSIPPSLNSSSALAATLSLSFNNSFNSSVVGRIKSPKGSKKDKILPTSEVILLEAQLAERLKTIEPSANINTDIFKVYQLIFEEVIRIDIPFRELLIKIKAAYEDWHSCGVKPSLSELLTIELNERTVELTRTKQEHSQLGKKLLKLAKENAEVSRALEETEVRYLDLKDQLLKLTKVKDDSVPKDENSWKYILSENKYYAEILKTLKRDLKTMKRREDKLLKLFYALKQLGYPVEQVYKEECRKAKQSKLPYKEVQGSNTGDEDVEPLVIGPPKAVDRPKAVPLLSLKEVEPDLTSESESEAEYSESSASSKSEQIAQIPS